MARCLSARRVRVLIMASHPGKKWKGKTPQHLVMVGGEKLLLRTIRQLGKWGVSPTVITHLSHIQEVVPKFFVPEKRRWYTETLLHTREIWYEKVVVLQGDVVYSNAVMRGILYGEYPLCLYRFSSVREGVHGFVFHESHFESVVAALEAITANAKADPQHYTGNQGFLSRYLNEQMPGEVYEVILPRDYTRDFDHRQDYKTFLTENPWARSRE